MISPLAVKTQFAWSIQGHNNKNENIDRGWLLQKPKKKKKRGQLLQRGRSSLMACHYQMWNWLFVLLQHRQWLPVRLKSLLIIGSSSTCRKVCIFLALPMCVCFLFLIICFVFLFSELHKPISITVALIFWFNSSRLQWFFLGDGRGWGGIHFLGCKCQIMRKMGTCHHI